MNFSLVLVSYLLSNVEELLNKLLTGSQETRDRKMGKINLIKFSMLLITEFTLQKSN